MAGASGGWEAYTAWSFGTSFLEVHYVPTFDASEPQFGEEHVNVPVA